MPVFGDADLALDAALKPAGRMGAGGGTTAGFYRAVRGGADMDDSAMRQESGSRAIAMGKAIRELKDQDNAANELTTVKYVGKKVFTLLDDRWIDTAFKPDMKIATITFGSAEYFKLLTDKPELKDFLALGVKVTVVLEDGTALVVE